MMINEHTTKPIASPAFVLNKSIPLLSYVSTGNSMLCETKAHKNTFLSHKAIYTIIPRIDSPQNISFSQLKNVYQA